MLFRTKNCVQEISKLKELITLFFEQLNVNNNKIGSVCVIGPTRMDYNQVIEALEFLSDKLEELQANKKES